jgi:Reverse transcriptase (RNA-dependent DNA polymerase)
VTEILDHDAGRQKKNPTLKILWSTGEETWEPFKIMKADIPTTVANYVIDKELGPPFSPTWAKDLMKEITIRRVTVMQNRRKKLPKIVNGVVIPNHIKHALELDEDNGDTLWAESINKERNSLKEHEVFKKWDKAISPREYGYQFVPMQTIFNAKTDGRRKTRIVLMGNVTNADEYDTYADTISTPNVRLIIIITVNNTYTLLGGDVAVAYLNAYTEEKIFVIPNLELGPENTGIVHILNKALYGAKGSANAWWIRLGQHLRDDDFHNSRIDLSFWYKLNQDYDLYDYLIHHVDDYMNAGPGALVTFEKMASAFTVTGSKTDIPALYLGMNMEPLPDGSGISICAKDYITKKIPEIEDLIGQPLSRQSTPSIVDWHPEEYVDDEDDSTILDASMVKIYQRLLGIGTWLVIICRLDITYAINTLARYTHVAHKKHYRDLIRVFEYLNKTRNLGIAVTENRLEWTRPPGLDAKMKDNMRNMRKYYPDLIDEWDKNWPEPKGKPVKICIFVDADHGHNRKDRRSVTGIIILLNSIPYKWKSHRQTSADAATFGAELTAGRVAIEEAIATIHMLRSIGVPVDGPAEIYIDNSAVISNVTLSGSTLKKKHLSIAYHMMREAQALGLVEIFHIDGENNVADIFTKPVQGPVFHKHVGKLMIKCGRDESEHDDSSDDIQSELLLDRKEL